MLICQIIFSSGNRTELRKLSSKILSYCWFWPKQCQLCLGLALCLAGSDLALLTWVTGRPWICLSTVDLPDNHWTIDWTWIWLALPCFTTFWGAIGLPCLPNYHSFPALLLPLVPWFTALCRAAHSCYNQTQSKECKKCSAGSQHATVTV